MARIEVGPAQRARQLLHQQTVEQRRQRRARGSARRSPPGPSPSSRPSPAPCRPRSRRARCPAPRPMNAMQRPAQRRSQPGLVVAASTTPPAPAPPAPCWPRSRGRPAADGWPSRGPAAAGSGRGRPGAPSTSRERVARRIQHQGQHETDRRQVDHHRRGRLPGAACGTARNPPAPQQRPEQEGPLLAGPEGRDQVDQRQVAGGVGR